MQVYPALTTAFPRFVFKQLHDLWQHIQKVFNAVHANVELPRHPIARIAYNKYTPWPSNLDRAAHSDIEVCDLTPDQELVTPLHTAAYGNNVRALYRLIAAGADVNAKDCRGQTPAYWAAYHGQLQALIVLSSFGAQLDQKDYRGKTPLRAASKKGHEEVIAFLFSHKVAPNTKDGRGLTPLHVAAFHRRFNAFEALVYHKADQTVQDSSSRNPVELLYQKCEEVWSQRFFLFRLVTTPLPPKSIRRLL